MPGADYNSETVSTFDRNAGRYADKYFALRDYDTYYDLILSGLPKHAPSFIDVACGPGNVSAYVREGRPDATICCVDQSLLMLSEAKKRVGDIAVVQADCRDLSCIQEQFDAAAFFFGLSYFGEADAGTVINQLHRLLRPQGFLLLASIIGNPGDSGIKTSASGDSVSMFFRTSDEIEDLLREGGFQIEFSSTIPSPGNASMKTDDAVFYVKRIEKSPNFFCEEHGG